MGAEPVQEWRKSLASTLDWWSDAGVDMLVDDDARDWLAVPVARAATATVAADVAAPVAEVLPATLEAFLAWRLGEGAPEADWMTPRIAPQGPADAEWVVFVDMPEADDSEGLLGGSAGKMFDRMLGAIGLRRDSVYLASLAVAHPLGGQIPGDQEARLVQLARHHLSLLKPRRLLLLGNATARILAPPSGSDPSHGKESVNQFAGEMASVASYHPRFLIGKPAFKSEAWKHLLQLNRGLVE
ncbi:uracil-DNA glycosylase family protein [Sphingomonas sp. M1-B02]|uniref:uracil-DNA glycosylase family protein n=1 Tax=Sphingomonas sp. M1-B02 TaxID=3114300 RepID=UPI00224050F7|nr:uracil-DNA glycosylase family protein [Sphingomonas sp. S6-11]UZK67208.1 uracil-DNA glycosylase [Sphingomonas sp. S6-11]